MNENLGERINKSKNSFVKNRFFENNDSILSSISATKKHKNFHTQKPNLISSTKQYLFISN